MNVDGMEINLGTLKTLVSSKQGGNRIWVQGRKDMVLTQVKNF